MIYALSFQDKDKHPKLFDDMFRERHRLYVEGRGWKELGSVDGREMDQFDRSSTVYLMAIGSDGGLLGSIRLNPSTNPHLLDTIFPELCSRDDIPRGIDTWEMSRLFVCHHSEFDDEGVTIKGRLFCAMFEFCLMYDISTVSAVCDSYFLPRVLKAGVKARPLGIPKSYQSGEMMAVQMQVASDCLAKIQSHYRVPSNSLRSTLSSHNGHGDHIRQDLPSDSGELNDIVEISREAQLLQDIGAVDTREEYVARFSELVLKLANGSSVEVTQAEKELDELTEQVRTELFGDSGRHKLETKRLQ